jgi:hypothetical protein
MDIEYKGYFVLIDSVPTALMDEWESTLKGERARILNALQTKIPNADEFISKLANPSATAWASFINDAYPDADLIKLRQGIKVKKAYSSWSGGIQTAFAQGGTFEQNVTAKKSKFNMARYPMSSVGIRYLSGWGVAYKCMGFISGDNRVMVYMGANDSVTGTPTDIFLAGAGRFARATGVPLITQGLVMAYYAHEAGLTTDRDAVITAINNKLNNTVEKMVDTSKWTNVDVCIGFDAVAGKLYARATATPV